MPKDWTDKIKNRSAASEFLKPFAAGNQEEPKESVIKDNDNNNDIVNINVEQQEHTSTGADPDFLDQLLEEGKKKKKDDLVLTGIYLQPDLAHILDSLGKKGGRGAKSRIVNDALRKLFTEKRLI